MNKRMVLVLTACIIVTVAGCGNTADKPVSDSTTTTASAVTAASAETSETTTTTTTAGTSTADEAVSQSIDYLALVNKLNPLPEGWEAALETVTITNSVGDEVEVEKKAYDA